MKLLAGLLLSANAQSPGSHQHGDGTQKYYWFYEDQIGWLGSCSTIDYPDKNKVCATKCPASTVGRQKKIKHKRIMRGANTYVAHVMMKHADLKPKDPYIGILQFERSKCRQVVLNNLRDTRVDVGDASGNYIPESRLYLEKGHKRDSVLLQWRRNRPDSTDLVNKAADRLYYSVSGIMNHRRWDDTTQTVIPVDEYDAMLDECLDSAKLSFIKYDYEADQSVDYTRCFLYNQMGLEIDWQADGTQITDEDPTTVEPSTADPGPTVDPPGPTIDPPSGAWCPSNHFFEDPRRIVGGDEADPHSWRWIVSVGGFCGGTIIHDNWVVSAAHCCDFVSPGVTLILAGAHSISSSGQTYTVSEVHNHPRWDDNDGFGMNNDICLLKIDGDLVTVDTEAKTRGIACLPESGEHIGNMTRGGEPDNCWVAGWGALAQGGGSPDKLHEVHVEPIDAETCENESIYGQSFDKDTEFCAGWMQGGKDSCQGDSGGPLVCYSKDNKPYLYGVVSWGAGCAQASAPGVYAKVSSQIEWMADVIGVDPPQPPATTADPVTTTADPGPTDWETGEPNLPNSVVRACPAAFSMRFAGREHKKGWKIVGGTIVDAGSWPWIANMNFNGGLCGGSIVDNEYIVTAAHCCAIVNKASDIYANIGQWNRVGYDEGEFQVVATDFRVHEDYGAVNGISHDICVVKVPDLAQAMPDSCNKANGDRCWEPVCLPDKDEHPAQGKHCWVAGWGTTSAGGNISNKLRDVGVNMMSKKYCTDYGGYSGESIVDSVEFCAGIPDLDGDGQSDGGKDACQGDSGGPLVCVDDKLIPTLYGVVSWGIGCAYQNYPGVYAKVGALRPWIDQAIDDMQ